MSKKLSKVQKARAAALEAALGALSAGVGRDAAWTAEPEEVLTYAKFILGKRPATDTPLLEVRTRLDSMEADEKFPRPVGEDPGDREVLTQWAEAIRSQNAEQEAALEAAALESEPEVGETNNSAGAAEWIADDGRPLWGTRPEVRTVTLTPASSPVDKRIAEETMGLVPGALDEELTFTHEGAFFADGSPAEKARAEAKTDLSAEQAPVFHSAATSEKAPDYVLKEGKDVGCPKCSAEAERQRERDEALDRGRVKLGNRLPAGEFARTGPLDEDELLAVAGSELYPAGDEEPSRELKIRNRKGEVWSYVSGGWTPRPRDPWAPRQRWTSREMVRRGPWHVV